MFANRHQSAVSHELELWGSTLQVAICKAQAQFSDGTEPAGCWYFEIEPSQLAGEPNLTGEPR